jgi:small-conductance mechanosensitive channel
MHIKDPINFTIWSASAILGALALYLYWPDIRTLATTDWQADENRPVTAMAPPVQQAPPPLSPADLQKLSPEERARYQAMQQSLQQVLHNVQALDQENARLKQEIQNNATENQALNPAIDKLRPSSPPVAH